MTASHHPRTSARSKLNHLKRGVTYIAKTRRGLTHGEYLGIETPHGEPAILLRRESGTASIPVEDVSWIRTVCA